MLRKVVVICLAIALPLAIQWLLHLPAQDPAHGIGYIGPETWQMDLRNLVLGLIEYLLPGFIVGAMLRSRQLPTGALVTALVPAVFELVSSHDFLRSLINGINHGVYGLAGSALGLIALGRSSLFGSTAPTQRPSPDMGSRN
jgi:hypothetical protein